MNRYLKVLSKNSIQYAFAYFIYGIIYSLAIPLSSSNLLQFIPRLAFFRCLSLGVIFCLAGVVCFYLQSLFENNIPFLWVPFFASILHYTSWTHELSYLYYYFGLTTLPTSIDVLTIVLLATVILGVPYFLLLAEAEKQTLPAWFFPIIVVLLPVVFWFVLTLIPTEVIYSRTRPTERMTETSPTRKGLSSYIYPLEIPFKQGLERYGFLFNSSFPDSLIIFVQLDNLSQETIESEDPRKELRNESFVSSLRDLSKDGTTFRNYYVHSNDRFPSVASLLTGHYPSQHGMLWTGVTGSSTFTANRFSQKQFNLVEELNRQGYETWGSVYTKYLGETFGFDRGFETYVTPDNSFITDLFSLHQSIFWLLKNQNERSFIYLHSRGGHFPFEEGANNQRFLKNSRFGHDKMRRFIQPLMVRAKSQIWWRERAMQGTVNLTQRELKILKFLHKSQVNLYDRKVLGGLIKNLRSLGLYDNATIIVTSPNGESLGDHGKLTYTNNPLYEDVINVPLTIKWPSSYPLENNSKISEIIGTVDLSATILEMAGASYQKTSGESFLTDNNKLRFENSVNRAFAQMPSDTRSIKKATVVGPRYKLIKSYENSNHSLYDLRDDPDELRSIHTIKSNLAKRLSRVIDRKFPRLPNSDTAPIVSFQLPSRTKPRNNMQK